MRGFDVAARCVAVVLTAALFFGVPPASSAQGRRDLIDTLAATGSLREVLVAIRAAGFVGVLRRPGPFTVFAPSDDAFDALPPGVFNMVLHNKRQITGIVAYHVVAGRLTTADMTRSIAVTTLEGESLRITGGSRRVNGARIIRPDLAAANGVIHIIDRILLPRAR